MAIAPLPQIEELVELESPWPKAQLRLVRDPSDRQLTVGREEPMTWANGRDVTERRQRRAARHLRWRRLLVATAVVSLVVLLVLPLRALGTVTVSGQPTPGGTPAGLMDGSVYVVQPGDTLSSIAHRINPSGDQRAMAAQMASEVGSSVVVPGEHVVLP